MKTARSAPALALLVAVAATPASAQLLGGALPGVGGLPGGVPAVGMAAETLRGVRETVPGSVDRLGAAATGTLASYRAQARDLLRRHPDLLEADGRGRPVVRGEVVAMNAAPEALARAQAEGFQLRGGEPLAALGLEVVVLEPPRGMSARAAVRRLRDLDPQGQYDLNHIYLEGGALGPAAVAQAGAGRGSGQGLRVGLVDGSVAADQPALAGARLVQRAFAPGGARVSAHATAIASLIAGSSGAFRGAAPGASLYVADVYGPTAAGGSALSVARALAWLAEVRAPVINISLVGPPNTVLAAAVEAINAKGHLLVAAVGNDGPAAPPLYPAAYPGVVAVTAVDRRRRPLPEAGRGPHLDFAAPGADMAAAGPGGGFVSVRGTSFAAPIAAGRLARLLPSPDPSAAARAVEALGREAVDLGPSGPDLTYGRGLVGFDLAVQPSAVAARRSLRDR